MNSTSKLLRAALVALVVLSASCYSTTVRNGSTVAASPTVEYDGKWHSGLIYGLAELSGPYDLSAICPSGWAEVHTETSFVNGLVQALTFSIYNPQSVTVKCQAGAAAPTEAPAADAAATAAPDDAAPATEQPAQ